MLVALISLGKIRLPYIANPLFCGGTISTELSSKGLEWQYAWVGSSSVWEVGKNLATYGPILLQHHETSIGQLDRAVLRRALSWQPLRHRLSHSGATATLGILVEPLDLRITRKNTPTQIAESATLKAGQ